MRNLTLALTSAAVLLVPAAAQAQSGLSSIFNCNSQNSRQGSGAVIGGLLGGVVGNQVAGDDDRTLGTVLGAALGAAAGSYVGCQMTPADAGQAEAATLQALNENRSTTWSNGRTGGSGRIDIVNSFSRADASAWSNERYDDDRGQYRDDRGQYRDGRDDGYDRRGYDLQSLNSVQFVRGVQRPVNFDRVDARYQSSNRVNVRAGPNPRARVMSQLRPGETFDAVANVGGQWLLAARNGVAIGYVNQSVVRFIGDNRANYANGRGRDNDVYGYDNRGRSRPLQQGMQTCRTFDQTVQMRTSSGTARPTTQRFTACQNARGEWVLEA